MAGSAPEEPQPAPRGPTGRARDTGPSAAVGPPLLPAGAGAGAARAAGPCEAGAGPAAAAAASSPQAGARGGGASANRPNVPNGRPRAAAAAAASEADAGPGVGLAPAPEVGGLRGLHQPHLPRQPGLLGARPRRRPLQQAVVVAVPSVLGVVGRRQDVEEGGGPVHGVDLVEVVGVRREQAGRGGRRVVLAGAEQGAVAGPGGGRRGGGGGGGQRVHAGDAQRAVEHLQHAVHARVVVQRDAGAAPQQEHAHAEALRLADVHVADGRHHAGPREPPARRRRRRRPPRRQVQVFGAHLVQQLLQPVQVLPEGRPRRAAEGDARLPRHPLDQGGHVVPGHGGARPGPAAPGPRRGGPAAASASSPSAPAAQARPRRRAPRGS